MRVSRSHFGPVDLSGVANFLALLVNNRCLGGGVVVSDGKKERIL